MDLERSFRPRVLSSLLSIVQRRRTLTYGAPHTRGQTMTALKPPVPPRAMSPTRTAAAAVAAAAALGLTFLFALVLSPALTAKEKHYHLLVHTEAPGFRFSPRAMAATAAQFAKSATLTVSSSGTGAAAAATTNGKSDRTVTVASSGASTATVTGTKCAAAWGQCGGNGRGLHSSTSWLNLSRVCHKSTP